MPTELKNMLFDITCLTFDITLNTEYLHGDKEERDWENHKFQNSMKNICFAWNLLINQ